MKETKQKNWFRRHWIVSIILGIFILGIIGSMFNTESGDYSTGTSKNSEITNLKSYTDEDLYTLIYLFVSDDSSYTELQKEEEFKQYKNKWIKTSGLVKEIDDMIIGREIVVRIEHPDNYLLSGATLYFKPTEKDKLLEINKYDEISFEGRIKDYNSFLGIMIDDVELR